MTCRQAREAFAVAPMLISGWTCIANSLSPEVQAQLMTSEPLHLLRTLERLRLSGVHNGNWRGCTNYTTTMTTTPPKPPLI